MVSDVIRDVVVPTQPRETGGVLPHPLACRGRGMLTATGKLDPRRRGRLDGIAMAKKREGAGIKHAKKQAEDGYYARNLVVDVAAIDDETYYLSRKMMDAFRECLRKLFSEIVWGLIATGDVKQLEIPDEARKAAAEETAKRKAKGESEEEDAVKVKLKRQKWGKWRAVTVPNYQLLREMMCVCSTFMVARLRARREGRLGGSTTSSRGGSSNCGMRCG